jgi:glutamate dehydrogenase
MLRSARDVLVRGTRWFMRHRGRGARIGETVARFRPGIASIRSRLTELASESHSGRLAAASAVHVAGGVEAELARTIAGLPDLLAACDIVRVAPTSDEQPQDERLFETARLYFALDDALGLPWLRSAIQQAPRPDRWHRLALTGLEDDLSGILRGLTAEVMAEGAAAQEPSAAAASVARWLDAEVKGLSRYRALIQELQSTTSPELPMLTVAVRTLEELLPGDTRR